ncbi:MBL fold metallo-hydrolase [soil metagenome]
MMILADPVQHLRIIKPAPFIYCFYDGRIAGVRLHADTENWLDDGGYSLGTASYALVDEDDALIYDTHLTTAHAMKIRKFIEALGVKRIRVVVSHHHLDHIAGNAVFADCEMISHTLTLAHLTRDKAVIEAGRKSGPPAITPLVLPTRTYEGDLQLDVGRLSIHLRHANIHSDDETLLHVGDLGILLAGDTLEDTVTYVAEPKSLDIHLRELDRLWGFEISRILPNHGSPDIIRGGGYQKTFIRATQQYIRGLLRCVGEPDLREADLKSFIAGPLQAGWVTYFEPYEAVHRQNVRETVAAQSH